MYQGVEFSTRGAPIHHLNPPKKLPAGIQRANLDFLRKLNVTHLGDRPGESELEARIDSYELAYRMQAEAPEAVDLSQESEATKAMYGMDREITEPFGRQCLQARRLVERGVRFVQVYSGAGGLWDSHQDHEKMTEIAGEKSSTIVFPIPMNLMEAVSRLVVDNADSGDDPAASAPPEGLA